jgi:large subunit ribosomal protein L13
MNNNTIEQHVIDASGKRLGRIASEVAALLMGKHRADAVRNTVAPISVKVEHLKRLLIDEKKRNDKTYTRYTGYPGGLRRYTMQKLIDSKGFSEVFRKAVYGMLPSNRLRAKRMKNLTVSE